MRNESAIGRSERREDGITFKAGKIWGNSLLGLGEIIMS